MLFDIGWEGYQTLLRMLGERPVRVTYDRGNVELMTTSPIHEIYKHLLGRMVDTIGEELDIPMFGQGSTTFNREDVDRGLEPDECYYIANAGRVADRSQLNLETDPPPDLAIEMRSRGTCWIDWGSTPRWGFLRFGGSMAKRLCVLLLGADGTYSPSESMRRSPSCR